MSDNPLIDWDYIFDHGSEILDRLNEHIELTAIAVAVGLAIAFPLALFAYKHRRFYGPLVGVTGVLYTIPSLALFAFLVPYTGLSVTTAEIGLVSYTLLILIRNTVVGLDGVPEDVREAAIGMGYSQRQLLWRVELPIAVPVIVAGVRIATVTTIGLVTVTALIGQGGLGHFILVGLQRRFNTTTLLGAVLSIALAVVADAILLGAQRLLTPWARTGARQDGDLMGVLSDTITWFTESSHWSGTFGVPHRVLEHVQMSALTTGLATLIALPVGLYIGHARRFEFLAISVGNIGRALPSFAVLALLVPFTSDWPGEFGFWPTLIALVLLGIPPILLNAYAGVRAIDPDTVEAARGMGMTGSGVLRKVESPLAAPVIVAGIRIAAVQIIATATLWALIGGGGLGRYIIDGFAQRDQPQIVAGAILVAILAIGTELALGLVERRITPGKKRKLSEQFEDLRPPSAVGAA